MTGIVIKWVSVDTYLSGNKETTEASPTLCWLNPVPCEPEASIGGTHMNWRKFRGRDQNDKGKRCSVKSCRRAQDLGGMCGRFQASGGLACT